MSGGLAVTTTTDASPEPSPALRLLGEQWIGLRKQFRAPSDVIFASARRVLLLSAAEAYDMARLLGVPRQRVERMRTNANRFGQWVIVIDTDGKAAAFVITNPQESRPVIRQIGVGLV